MRYPENAAIFCHVLCGASKILFLLRLLPHGMVNNLCGSIKRAGNWQVMETISEYVLYTTKKSDEDCTNF